MTSRFLKLKGEHPTLLKIEKIFALMEELGISFDFSNCGMTLTDSKQDKFSFFYIKDLESDDQVLDSLPLVFEYKVLADNPKYLEEQEIDRNKRIAEAKQREEAAALALIEAEKKKKIAKLNERKAAIISLNKQVEDLERELKDESEKTA